jgi:aryl-alcohol dehydrogenase-like predicted oxidoreductase
MLRAIRRIPLIAASRDEQMRENIGALDVQLNADQLQRLTNARG